MQAILKSSSPASLSRLKCLDILRALAVIGMIIYHFGWDLALFGYLTFADVTSGTFVLLAHGVVVIFLFLVGFSLYLAHGASFRRNSFMWRLIKIIASAALVSLATFVAFPDAFIYFGILHHIALASLIGLVCLRLPLVVNGVLAIVIWLVPFYWRPFSHPLLVPLGLTISPPFSFDYVPLFPWFAVVLAGIFCARLMQVYNLFFLLGAPSEKREAVFGQKMRQNKELEQFVEPSEAKTVLVA